MVDVFAVEKRSQIMSAVRSRGNRSTELRFAGLLRRAAIRGWRRHYPIVGKPDFVFSTERVAVFLDGCFWHSCPRGCKRPPQKSVFWSTKLAANRKRDRYVTSVLRKRGWTVVRIWEHSLSREPDAVIRRLRTALCKKATKART